MNIIGENVSLPQLQKSLLLMMIDIDKLCKKHDIKYSLGAGTALGAVRHHGFIPWDDDVDLVFLRPEYERFLKIAKAELEPLGYFVQEEFTENWPMTYSKIRKNGTTYIENFDANIKGLHQGIFIDIFPVDNMYESMLMQEIQWRAYQLVCAKGLKKRGYKTDSINKKTAMFLSAFIPEKLLVSICKASRKKNSKYVNVFLGGATGKKRNIHRRNIFNDYVDITFESESFRIIKEYDEYLKTTYGNYMVLPPEKDRIEAIHACFVSLNESYEKFIK